MTEYRCECGKLLFRGELQNSFRLEIKCTRCKKETVFFLLIEEACEVSAEAWNALVSV